MKNKDNEEALNEYIELTEEICPELIDLIYPIFQIACDYLVEIEDFLQLDIENFEYEKMNIFENLRLVREFVEKFDNQNLQKLDNVINNGNLDLFYSDGIEDDVYVDDKENEALCIEVGSNPILNIPLKENIYDGALIIHEFYHYTNSNKKDKGVREVLTELISIYMELRYLQFLEEKGYHNVLNYGIYDRIDCTNNSADNIFYSGSALDIYNSTGDINNKSIRFLGKFREEYKNNKKIILDFIKQQDFGEAIFDFHYDAGYLLGGIIGICLLNNPEINDIKIKYINDNLDKLTLSDVFELLDFNLDNDIPWIEEVFNKLEGVLNEESNRYNRTYQYRKN